MSAISPTSSSAKPFWSGLMLTRPIKLRKISIAAFCVAGSANVSCGLGTFFR
jgi:hypothetical protein